MTEKEKLMATLFASADREHVSIEFVRGASPIIAPERFCREVRQGIEQIASGVVTPIFQKRRASITAGPLH